MMILAAPLLLVLVAVVTGLVWQTVWGFHSLDQTHWQWLWDYFRAYRQLPAFFQWGTIAAAIAYLFGLMGVMALASRISAHTKHGGRDDKTLHGSAHWASARDVRKTGLLRKAGVTVGGWPGLLRTRTLRHDGPEHVLAFAPPRSGKGVGLVLPTLLSWPSSVIVLDIKGENWRLTSGWRKAQGQRILKFDPTAEGGVRFNPLAEIRIDTDHQVADAQNIAVMIVDPDGKGLADFWAKSGYAWLTGTILYTLYKVRADEGRIASLPDLDWVLTAVDEGGVEGLFEDMLVFKTGSQAADDLIHAAAQEMKNRAAQERSGVQSSAKVDLSIYRDPIIARNISESDFRLSDLMNGDDPASLYLVVPPSDIDRLRPLLRVILNLFMRRLMQNVGADGQPAYRHKLLLMLDEFTSIGKLEIFERSLAFMAGYGIKAYLIIQDIKQLQKEYGRENSIMGNCHVRIAYAPNDVDTAKLLSAMCGKTTIVQNKRSVNKKPLALFGQVTDSVAESSRDLLTPDECMRLKGPEKTEDGLRITKAGDMLTFVAGSAPILGRQPLYFFDKNLLARSQLPPDGGRPAEAGAAIDEEEKTEAALPPGHDPGCVSRPRMDRQEHRRGQDLLRNRSGNRHRHRAGARTQEGEGQC